MSDLIDTLGNTQWLKQNETNIKALLPDVWTHMENLNGLKLAFGFKLVGIEWKSENEFGRIMLFLEKVGILQRTNGYQIRANPISIFKGVNYE